MWKGLRDKEFRREFCMAAALLVGVLGLCFNALNFSHGLGYWPHGLSERAAAVETKDQSDGTPGQPRENGLMQVLIFALTCGSLVTAAVLYYRGRKHPALAEAVSVVPKESDELKTLRAEIDRLNAHRVDLLGTITGLNDKLAQQTGGSSSPPPTIGLTVRETVVEPYDTTPGRNYPRKMRVYLSNDGDEIHLGKGKWITDGVGVQKGRAQACMYELKDHLGKFSGETDTKIVPSGKWFRLYVGLDSFHCGRQDTTDENRPHPRCSTDSGNTGRRRGLLKYPRNQPSFPASPAR